MTDTRNELSKYKKPKYDDVEVLDTKLGSAIYRQLLKDGIDSGEFWIADLAIGMYHLLQQSNRELLQEIIKNNTDQQFETVDFDGIGEEVIIRANQKSDTGGDT